MNTLQTSSSTTKLIMWYEIKEKNRQGLNKSQISRVLGIDRGRVRRYLSMSENEFLASNIYSRDYSRKLDDYEAFVRKELERYPFLSSSQIEDRLKERYAESFNACSKTVFNFVMRVRKKYGISKPSEEHPRQYEKIPETPFGDFAQVDFGERYMSTPGKGSQKVYFFAMVLCRSRYKFLYFSTTPFNTALTVYAHELAFNYFGGKPKTLIYDQDKVLISKENLGDYILTKGFRSFVNEQHIGIVFCRKSDPESKGKVENVVKYVKGNFLKGREFENVEKLNQDGLAWLERTGNGSMHHGIHRIPAEVFEEERPYLAEYTGVPTPPSVDMKSYKVRKDNTISFRCCFYSLPTGTYKSTSTEVLAEEKDDQLIVYDKETGKVICQHQISRKRGESVINSSHRRDRGVGLETLEETIVSYIGDKTMTMLYLQCLKEKKSRYYRDSLELMKRQMVSYNSGFILQAMEICLEKGTYNARVLFDVVQTLSKTSELSKTNVVDANSIRESAKDINERIGMPEKTDIQVFSEFFK